MEDSSYQLGLIARRGALSALERARFLSRRERLKSNNSYSGRFDIAMLTDARLRTLWSCNQETPLLCRTWNAKKELPTLARERPSYCSSIESLPCLKTTTRLKGDEEFPSTPLPSHPEILCNATPEQRLKRTLLQVQDDACDGFFDGVILRKIVPRVVVGQNTLVRPIKQATSNI